MYCTIPGTTVRTIYCFLQTLRSCLFAEPHSPLAGSLAKLARLVQELRDGGDAEPAKLRELQRLLPRARGEARGGCCVDRLHLFEIVRNSAMIRQSRLREY